MTDMALVLVVDDSPLFSKAYKLILEENGYVVEIAKDGYEALIKTKEVRPDLILTDVVMPLMNGFQLCRMIRKDSDISHTLIIVTSTKNTETDAIWAKRQGADEYLVKPVKREALLKAVDHLLQTPKATLAKP